MILKTSLRCVLGNFVVFYTLRRIQQSSEHARVRTLTKGTWSKTMRKCA